MPQEFAEHPLGVFERNVWVNPFWEDSLTGLVDEIGAERVCFGSDFPHAEGLAEPIAWAEQIEDLPAADRQRIMSSNMFDLMGLTPPVPLVRT